jgi:hypothetical protein
VDSFDDDRTDPAAAMLARTGRMLALLGFVPFAVLALWLYGIAPDHPWRQGTILLLTTYAAIVLSFLGGIRWGLALLAREGEGGRDINLSILPPLMGWIAVIVPPPLTFVFLAVAFAAQGAWDSLTLTPERVPAWYRRVRIQLTILVVAALVVAFVATS